jgi:hypothetical protein
MSVRLVAASGREIVIRTDALSEKAACWEALKRARRDEPGAGWQVFGLAY